MTDEDRKLMCEMIEQTVTKTVNGKILSLDKKVSEHIAKVEPYLEAAAGAKILGGGLRWIAGIVVAWAVVKTIFTGGNIPSL